MSWKRTLEILEVGIVHGRWALSSLFLLLMVLWLYVGWIIVVILWFGEHWILGGLVMVGWLASIWLSPSDFWSNDSDWGN